MKPFIYNLDLVKKRSEKKLFNVVSLFAGGGGSSTGYRLAGGNILAINEFVPEAQNAYAKNYPDTFIFKDDIRKLTGSQILEQINLKPGELDILDGSPPCASFSTAGKRQKDWGKEKKYSDTKQITDDLFFEYARILKEVQPKVFVAENVKGLTMGTASSLLGSEQIDLFGEHKNTIYHTLVNCGYRVRYKVLNAKNYSVPQSRERTIFIGVRNDIKKEIIYPEIGKHIITSYDACKSVINSSKDIKDATHSEGIVKNYVFQLKEGESGDKYAPSGYYGLHRILRDQPCPTICQRQGNKGACLIHWEENRELTVPELVRLMSFPDDYYLGEKYTHKTERLGRAVPPLMMAKIAYHIYKTILL
jgi:DNA (cytosine-5)-methyltransferase 1